MVSSVFLARKKQQGGFWSWRESGGAALSGQSPLLAPLQMQQFGPVHLGGHTIWKKALGCWRRLPC